MASLAPTPTSQYRGRLAPSPTGYLHVGHARTFWTAWTRAREAGWNKLLAVAIARLFAAYAARTFTRVPDWRNDETLNLATAEAFPETPVPFLNLATYYERMEKDPAKALQALTEADRRAPGWRPARERAARLKTQTLHDVDAETAARTKSE